MDRWLPIESAPRDGTKILVWGLWAGEINGPQDEPCMAIARWLYGGSTDWPGFEWSVYGTDAYAAWMKPTHWQSLPVPPA